MRSLFLSLALFVLAAFAPAQQSVMFPAQRMAGEPYSLDIADLNLQADPPRAHWFDQSAAPWVWRVPVSPYGANTRAVRFSWTYTPTVTSAGFENKSAVPFLYVAQSFTWDFEWRLAPTRRAPALPVDRVIATYPYMVSNIPAYDGTNDCNGLSGRSWGTNACQFDHQTLLTEVWDPAEVNRFEVSYPGDPGFVRLLLVGGQGHQTWAGDDVTNPAPPYDTFGPGNSHFWTARCRALLMNVSVSVTYYDHIPMGP